MLCIESGYEYNELKQYKSENIGKHNVCIALIV